MNDSLLVGQIVPLHLQCASDARAPVVLDTRVGNLMEDVVVDGFVLVLVSVLDRQLVPAFEQLVFDLCVARELVGLKRTIAVGRERERERKNVQT